MSVFVAVALTPILALVLVRLMFRWMEEVESLQEQEVEVEEEPSVDLSSHTVKELRALAKERGLKGVSQLKKADLIKRLQ